MTIQKFWGIFLCCLITFTLSVHAYGQQTVFRDLTWEQAAALAKKEGKIVLVDAMMKPQTPEAQKQQETMLNDLFMNAEIADFCRKNVIAIRIDMSSEAGNDFAPKMAMYMYPAYAFFMPDGNILGVASPFMAAKDPAVLLKAGQKAVEMANVKKQNTRSIIFENLSFEEAMAKAKRENKLIFIDAYTAYCQPCMLMVKNIFSLDQVADFYNQHFINLKMDFGKDKELAEKYDTYAYPAFLFIDGNGKLIYSAGGYTEKEPFIQYGEEALKKVKGI